MSIINRKFRQFLRQITGKGGAHPFLGPRFGHRTRMVHSQADLDDLGRHGHLQGKILVPEVSQAEAPPPILAPHEEIALGVDGRAGADPAVDGLGHHHVAMAGRRNPTEKGRRNFRRHLGLLQVRPFAQDAIPPHEHVVVLWNTVFLRYDEGVQLKVSRDRTKIPYRSRPCTWFHLLPRR